MVSGKGRGQGRGQGEGLGVGVLGLVPRREGADDADGLLHHQDALA